MSRTEPRRLHGYEVTQSDRALIRMLAGAHFADNASVVLPSGIEVTGSELREWIEDQ